MGTPLIKKGKQPVELLAEGQTWLAPESGIARVITAIGAYSPRGYYIMYTDYRGQHKQWHHWFRRWIAVNRAKVRK